MKFEFDPAKDAANIKNHGLSLAEAEFMDWDSLWAKEDTRREYGEMRLIGYAFMGVRLYCVIFTDRDECRRVISLRKANDREVELYAQNH